MKTKNLLNSSRFSARLRPLLVMLATLTMFSLSALTGDNVLEITDFTPTNLDAVAQTMSISACADMSLASIIIPDSFEIDNVKYAVVDIAFNGFRYSNISDVQLPSSLVSIGDRAFQSVPLVSGVVIPASVVSIGEFAFSFAVDAGVTFETQSHLELIGSRAFRNATITLPTVRDGYNVTWYTGITTNDGGTVIPSPYSVNGTTAGGNSATYISSAAASSVLSFNANTSVGSMAPVASTVGAIEVLPANTFTKAEYYFKGWATTAVGEVMYADEASFTVAAEVEELFAVWGQLGELVLDNGEGVQETIVTGIDRTLTLPVSSFTKTGKYLYGWATSSEGDAYYSFEAFYTPTLITDTLYAIWLDIPADYTTMGMEMLRISDFTYTMSGQNLTITKYTGLGQDSTYLYFSNTYVVDSVDYTVVAIGNDAFDNQFENITNVILPNTLTTIGIRSLQKCNLDSITIPASVKTVNNYAFRSCPLLSKMIFEDESQLESIGVDALNNTPVVSFTLPSVRSGYSAVEWKEGTVVITDYLVLAAQFTSEFSAVWTEIPTAVAETSAIIEQLVISPNPADNYFTVNVNPMSTKIYSLSGQCVMQFPMGVSSFDVSSLEKGIYLVNVQEANGKMSVDQLIKK